MEQKLDPKEQKFLKTVDKTDRKIKRANDVIVTVGYCIITLVTWAMTIYYGICKLKGMEEGNYFFTALLCGILLILMIVVYKLLNKGFNKFIAKEQHFDPANMQLPAAGTVTLETAMHKMAPKNGVIIWDTLWGLLLGFFLLAGICFPNAKTDSILILCAVLAMFLFMGHFLLYRYWKKKAFTDSLVKNTQKYVKILNVSVYTAAVENGLKKRILYYTKNLILTENLIIGLTENDIGFAPVALPRKIISQISFYEKQVVSTRYSYTQGVLKCHILNGKQVSFLIGRGVQINKVLEMLNYYNIPFQKEETIYQ